MQSANPYTPVKPNAPAQRVICGAVFALMLTSLGGCAQLEQLSAPVVQLKDAVVASVAPAASAPAAAPNAASAAAASSAPAEVQAPIDPTTQRAFDEARRALRAGRTQEAERAFKALAQDHPELGGAHANLGLIYRNAGKTAEAVAACEQAVRASPRQAQFHNQLGIAYRHNGQFGKAREAYERAVELDPNFAAAILNLGIVNDMYLGDSSRALPLYERYLALTPGGDAAVGKWIADLKNRKTAAKNAAAPAAPAAPAADTNAVKAKEKE